MIVFREKIFDGYLSGTQDVFTRSDVSLLLGSTEELHLALSALGITGTGVNITVDAQTSPDGTRWIVAGNALSLGIGPGDVSTPLLFFTPIKPLLSHVRLRMSLSGTSPGGIFRLWAIGRTHSLQGIY